MDGLALPIRAGDFHAVDPFLQFKTIATPTQSLDDGGPPWIMVYCIIALFLGMALIFGRRAGCHIICWMAPFMILGRRLRNTVRWTSLSLTAESEKYVHCLTCSRGCPMRLDVHTMVETRDVEDSECILFGSCVDGCDMDSIHYTFSAW